MASPCPLAHDLFGSLTEAVEALPAHGDEREPEVLDALESGVIRDTLELFVEQFSQRTLGEPLLGVEQRTRDRLESLLNSGGFQEVVNEVLVTTIDLSLEVSAQAYVAVRGLVDGYLAPWLEALHAWLSKHFPECGCTTSLLECREAVQGV